MIALGSDSAPGLNGVNFTDFPFYVLNDAGDVTGDHPDYTYTPDPDFFGVDQVELVGHDGADPSAPAIFTIEVSPVPDPPKAFAEAYDLDEDAWVAVTLGGEDQQAV